MGRAMQVLKRRSHVTVAVAERPATEAKPAKTGGRRAAPKKNDSARATTSGAAK
jgi:hypothetical protein